MGFDVLPTWYLRSVKDCADVAADAFPICLRPSMGEGVDPYFKVELAATPDALERFVAGRTKVDVPIVAQPFLRLPNLVVHGVRSASRQILAMRSFLVPTKFQGVSLTLHPTVVAPAVEDACRRFVDEIGIVGCFHFELLASDADGKAYFLEINVRLGGTTNKVVKLGFDEPILHLRAFGFDVLPTTSPVWATAVNKRILVKHLLTALRGQLSQLDYPIDGRVRHAARDLRHLLTSADSNFDWRDLPGTMAFYLRR